MPALGPAGIGVSATVHVLPLSGVWRTRDLLAAPVPIQACDVPNTAMLVPLAANAPSFSSAGGNDSHGTRAHVSPLFVVKIKNCLSIESPMAIPCCSSQNDIASRKILSSSA